jgi:cell fate regulator YaaT (PSP1 superfamily)
VRLADAEDGKTTIVLAGEIPLEKGDRIIVESDGGPEIAEVMNLTPVLSKPCSSKKAKRLIRRASDAEMADFAERIAMQDRADRFVRTWLFGKDLPVKFIRCTVGFERRKATIHYASDERLALRDLTRDLSNELSIRVEARLTGVRDETKMMGGIGPCGLTLCCSTFLRGFHPVTIKMAKMQGITPNPSKLTGMCGRVKCCLAYELEGSIEAARRIGTKAPEKPEGPQPA